MVRNPFLLFGRKLGEAGGVSETGMEFVGMGKSKEKKRTNKDAGTEASFEHGYGRERDYPDVGEVIDGGDFEDMMGKKNAVPQKNRSLGNGKGLDDKLDKIQKTERMRESAKRHMLKWLLLPPALLTDYVKYNVKLFKKREGIFNV